MGLLTDHRVIRPAGLLLSLLTAMVLLPTPVRAGCSAHYLVPQDHASRIAQLDRLGQVSHPDNWDTSQAPERPRPCTGAFCSGNPAPLSSAQPTIQHPAGEWALAVRFLARPDQGSFHALDLTSGLTPRFRPGSVFHPPRSQANSTSV